MTRPKQQHFVTRAYLEGFLNPLEEHLVCYGRRRGPFRKSPAELASRRNYYALKKEDGTWDDSVEVIIQQTVESPGPPVIKKLVSGRHRLTRRERDSLALLISFQELRTPAARERTRQFLKLVNDRIFHEVRASDPRQNSIKIGGASGETTITLDEMAKSHETICDDHSMEIHSLLMGAALKVWEYYRHMKFTVYHSGGTEEFITTDSPVIRVFHGGPPIGTGINRPDVEVRFPLSRRTFLTLTHDMLLIKTLKRANKSRKIRLMQALPEIRIVEEEDSKVRAFNRAQARHAHQWVFAPGQLDWVAGVLSEPPATPKLLDLSSRDLMHFQSSVNYNPLTDSEPD